MSEETKQPEAQPQATAPQGEQKPVELTVQDLGVIRSVIDVASQRGAFNANDMEAVGKTYNKLDSFLQQVQKAEEDAKNADESAKETKGEK